MQKKGTKKNEFRVENVALFLYIFFSRHSISMSSCIFTKWFATLLCRASNAFFHLKRNLCTEYTTYTLFQNILTLSTNYLTIKLSTTISCHFALFDNLLPFLFLSLSLVLFLLFAFQHFGKIIVLMTIRVYHRARAHSRLFHAFFFNSLRFLFFCLFFLFTTHLVNGKTAPNILNKEYCTFAT